MSTAVRSHSVIHWECPAPASPCTSLSRWRGGAKVSERPRSAAAEVRGRPSSSVHDPTTEPDHWPSDTKVNLFRQLRYERCLNRRVAAALVLCCSVDD